MFELDLKIAPNPANNIPAINVAPIAVPAPVTRPRRNTFEKDICALVSLFSSAILEFSSVIWSSSIANIVAETFMLAEKLGHNNSHNTMLLFAMGNKPRKILVADDDTTILEAIDLILSDEGFEVLSIADGEVVEQNVVSYKPDLILLDIWLGGIDGGDIARSLKSNPDTKSVPIIVFSANNRVEKIASELPVEGFLNKPFDIDELVEVVNAHLSK